MTARRCPNANDEQCRFPACTCHAEQHPKSSASAAWRPIAYLSSSPPRAALGIADECMAMVRSCGGNPITLLAVMPLCMSIMDDEWQGQADRACRESEARVQAEMARFEAERHAARYPLLVFPEIAC